MSAGSAIGGGFLSELGVDCVAAPGDNDAAGYRAGMDLVRSVIGTSGE
jgi:hypothetical protein